MQRTAQNTLLFGIVYKLLSSSNIFVCMVTCLHRIGAIFAIKSSEPGSDCSFYTPVHFLNICIPGYRTMSRKITGCLNTLISLSIVFETIKKFFIPENFRIEAGIMGLNYISNQGFRLINGREELCPRNPFQFTNSNYFLKIKKDWQIFPDKNIGGILALAV
jgi:hypothetical protein